MDTNNESNNKNVSLSLIAEYGGSDSESESESGRACEASVGPEEEAELSEMVLKNNIINACAHGPLARLPDAEDDDDDSGHMIIDAQGGELGYQVTMYREEDSDSDSDSSDTDSDLDSVKDIEEIFSGDEESSQSKDKKVEAPKVNGELGLEDLPPIEDLAISLPAQQTTKIGTVSSIVEQLVIVKANPGTSAVDIDSVLFLENGSKTLGKVFDVFGPVKEPHYAVRFNSAQHVAARGVAVGHDVYIAPAHRQHTSYVFLPDLMKIRGSDASWKNDLEPPPGQVDYSDDEEERRVKREARRKHDDQRQGERRAQRPSDGSSRFGSGPSRGRNPFAAGSRRVPPPHPRGAAPRPLRFPPAPLFLAAPGGAPQWMAQDPPPPPGT